MDTQPHSHKRTRYQSATQISLPEVTASLQFELETLTGRQLALSTRTEEDAFAMAIRLGIVNLVPKNCYSCVALMRLEKDAKRAGGGRFRCSCGKSIAALTNTWFESSKLQNWQTLTLTYHFCCLEPLTKAAQQCQVADSTACYWYNYIRDVQTAIILNLPEQQIGGPGHVVEIDEFHCFTRKSHKGRTPGKTSTWGFGGIDVNTRDVFAVPVEKRNKEVLLPIIRKHVRPGTTIYTDMWRTY